MRKWIENSPVAVGVGLVLAGLVVIFLAWNGAAGKDFVEGQFPYLLSGGLVGLVLVAGGVAAILVQTRRRDNAELVERLDRIVDLLRETAAFPASGPTAVPTGPVVVAGRSTYHDPDCHIVEGRDDYRPLSADVAASRGLTPCRVCQPDVASA